ncbi:alpha/beta hydrolase fold domain-containing protein [Curtobacterium sp. MCLR17_007]|uniref:alpha/beta hydrolase fold domain-containing protein n=1 Tax=Curtobacterium sp. MCLR17_007 TaxID=2175648 RepID=UPI000DA8E337|nr:alpha/beta hydrolase fold domain-containing protein [Curtobacterium sp. MCLR17_007]WIB61645.1 alpha/beta hydrolase fold domain-containing protein [Curtobacterium sp. MCLR17_007]
MTPTHPDLRAIRFLPGFSWGPRLTGLVRRVRPRPADLGPEVTASELHLPGTAGNPDVSVRLLRPALAEGPTPLLLWVHGGGLISGSPEQDDRANAGFVRSLGIAVAAVRYRLAPDAVAPAAAEDVYSAFVALVERAGRLGIDPARIAIGGASAGGGLAAAATLMAVDRPGPVPVFQLLVYPMLDDRTVLRTDMDTTNVHVWMPGSNRYGWTSYLGTDPGSPDVSAYAAPARRTDLAGLPPAWVGVGANDLFHDEDVEYAERLRAAGIDCTLEVVPGAFHGFDAVMPKAGVSRAFWLAQARALQGALTASPRHE